MFWISFQLKSLYGHILFFVKYTDRVYSYQLACLSKSCDVLSEEIIHMRLKKPWK